jgi:tRNA G18 (ribose-2'-O)-methylase SpoU
VALAVRPLAFRGYDGAAPRPHSVWMALDRVDNPYNLGAILRTCAFFGVETVLVGGVAEGSAINGAALRAAEGGAETLRLVACAPLAPVLTELAWCGVRVVGLEPDAPVALGPEALDPPAVLVVGHEQEGLSPEVRGACSVIRAIPGRGAVSSLNVSVSAGIALAAFFSARGSGATRRPHDQAIGAEGPPPTAPPESPPRRPKRRGTKRRASGARRGG